MSSKLSPTRGLHRVETKYREYAIATKVTGRNLASVSYIISLEAERRGIELTLTTTFATDGSLTSIVATEGDDDFGVPILPGQYLVLEPGDNEAVIFSAEAYQAVYNRVD